MNRYTDRTLDRLGAASGVAAVVLLISLFTVFPALPAPNKSIAEIARSARQDADGLLLGAYVGTLLTGTLLVFGAVVAARLRRAEGAGLSVSGAASSSTDLTDPPGAWLAVTVP